jgi:UDP-N-acetylglucosamine 4-epimerase
MTERTYHSKDLSKFSFLITGGAGFIGSHLVEYLIKHNAKKVRILDNLSTGDLRNIRDFLERSNVEFIEGDIRNFDTCQAAVAGIDYVSHQAALGSVPRSINDPQTTNDVNIGGFLNMLIASKEANIKSFVYAASSSTYGDSAELPKQEQRIGNPLSPYAVTKYVNELYGQVFSRTYNFHSIGLRYFNVFGPRQNPDGPYAAVIPLFISEMLKSRSPVINGDGDHSRDFTFVSNVVQANIKAMLKQEIDSHIVINIAFGSQISLLNLVEAINSNLGRNIQPKFGEVRKGDVKHSRADITLAKTVIDYYPEIDFNQGIATTISYFRKEEGE